MTEDLVNDNEKLLQENISLQKELVKLYFEFTKLQQELINTLMLQKGESASKKVLVKDFESQIEYLQAVTLQLKDDLYEARKDLDVVNRENLKLKTIILETTTSNTSVKSLTGIGL